ncbi:MAG: carboxypeptidase regulatory-like domain-containing protein [Thermoanaerobaculia bacterium]
MRSLLFSLLVLAVAADVRAAARLTYELGGTPTPLAWSASAFPIPVSIGRAASQNLPTGEALIRDAFVAWEEAEGSSVSFRYEGITDVPAGKDGTNVVTINDELFEGSGFLAFTTTWFDQKTGELLEVDIQIDASAANDGVGVQTLVQHEIGHFLGFDHSGVLSSVMYPWVGADDLLGLDSDDRIVLTRVYPDAAKGGTATVRGTVRTPAGGVFGAQVVAVNRNGAPVSSTLTGPDGSYELMALPPGAYTVYVEPLDGPVETKNLSGVWRNGDAGAFRTRFRDGLQLAAGETRSGFDLEITNLAPELNPRWIGAFPEGAPEIRLQSTAMVLRAGTRTAIAVGGDGFVSGMTEFEILSPGFTRTSEFRYGPNYAWATYAIAPDAPASSVVILAKNGDATATLTGALRVEAGSPGRTRLVRR